MVTSLWNVFLLAAMLQTSVAFTSLLSPPHGQLSTQHLVDNTVSFQRRPSSALNGGFGGDSSKKKKEVKIKPKQQWDRYTKMKEKPFRVAVKAVDKANDEWLEVGNVKSKDGQYTEIAIARQRALIADHAIRLFPLQVSPKDTIEWAVWDADAEQWNIVDKAVLKTDMPEGIEKMIGFEGRPDPATGYYCMYNEGRLVTGESDLGERPSKKLR